MRSHFQEVELSSNQVLYEPGDSFRRVYFPITAVVSRVAIFEDGSAVDMATTGREGMAGIGAILGSRTAFSRVIVEVPGSALAVGFDVFKRLEEENPGFRRALLAFAQVFLAQSLQSVACNALHSVEERAARWLLMCHDRSAGDPFPLTQQFLAEMLGVSRPAVGLVARTLQRAGLIRYRRGIVTIDDREGLEECSCECYGIVRRQYEERLFRPLTESSQEP